MAMVKGGKAVAAVARALGLVEQTLRNWVKLGAKRQAAIRGGQRHHARSRWSSRGCGPRTLG